MSRLNIKYHGTGTLSNKIRGKVKKAREKIGNRIFAEWRRAINKANISPNAKRRYREGVKVYRSPRVGVYVSDKVAQLLEKGWQAFDMKPGLLKGLLARPIPINSNTMRTVSVNSPASSWKHPGYKGANVAQKVKNKVPDLVRNILTKAINE